MAFYLAPLRHMFPSFLVEAVPELAAMSPALRLVLLPEWSPWWWGNHRRFKGTTPGVICWDWVHCSINQRLVSSCMRPSGNAQEISEFFQAIQNSICALDWMIWQVMYHIIPGSRISTVHRKHSTKLVNRGHTTKPYSESSFHSNSRHKFNQNSGFCMQLSRQQKSELPHVPIY